jgi:hypothetical protein
MSAEQLGPVLAGAGLPVRALGYVEAVMEFQAVRG